MTIRVGVVGAGGRMGAEVCAAVAADPFLDLVAAVDPTAAGTAAPGGLEVAADLDALLHAATEVVVDFTTAEASRVNLEEVAAWGMHAVVGTSGLDADDVERLRSEFRTSNCLIAPNFAIGAVLMMRFAELAAPFFDSAEVIELHHDRKVDAPSGTAMATVQRMAAASARWTPDPTTTENLPGARGAVGAAGIHVHSVRLHGLVAHQEVLLSTAGQLLTLRHDSYDRSSFMPGVVLACKRIAEHPGVTVGLDGLMGI